jgi:RNA polymerase sigma factor (sigma-70 family)
LHSLINCAVFQAKYCAIFKRYLQKELDLTCSIKTYLFYISQHLRTDQLRQNKREIPLNYSYSYLNAAITVVGFENTPDIYDAVNIAIDKMGNSGKTILECFYYKKMSCEQIAETMGYSSAANVRNQKYKYLEKIRKSVILE